MALIDRLNDEIKQAMLSHDADKRDALRAVKSGTTLMRKEQHTDEVSDSMVVAAAQKEIKAYEQTILALKGKEDTPNYKSAAYRISLLKEYLPKQLSEEEVRAKISEIVAGLPADANFGAKMKAVMAQLKGQADGRLIQSILKTM